ncbi:hypothetical protein J9317_12570 [Metabacillus sp. KIGAM252]|uniref:Uncharacterized protein n=1 Tax=Metabacillus flavus TaxID=2823519 RepID=A0ABS5LG87_9BACI|nr:hypothetical protein [Metabacillus flavus]MBS2969599.1 hypothetical protein [Metabacillus flavus]
MEDNNILKVRAKILRIRISLFLIVSVILAQIYYIFLLFEPYEIEMLKLSHFEVFLWFPFYYTFLFIPVVFAAGFPLSLLHNYVAKIYTVNHLIRIVPYLIFGIILVYSLPFIINDTLTNSRYDWIVNPYYSIPVIGIWLCYIVESYLLKKEIEAF